MSKAVIILTVIKCIEYDESALDALQLLKEKIQDSPVELVENLDEGDEWDVNIVTLAE